MYSSPFEYFQSYSNTYSHISSFPIIKGSVYALTLFLDKSDFPITTFTQHCNSPLFLRLLHLNFFLSQAEACC